MGSRDNVCVIGSSNVDLIFQTDNIPSPGETVMSHSYTTYYGGKGANQAIACSRMGKKTHFISKVGGDEHGKSIKENLKSEGIITEYVSISQKSTGTAIICVAKNGQNSIIISPGANGDFLPEDFLQVKEDAFASALILLQLEIPMPTVSEVISEAQTHGKRVILNPAPAKPLADGIYHGLFLITPNETEASELSGIQVKDYATAEMAADFFLEKGVRNVIITMGASGAFFKNKEESFVRKAFPANVLDTTGAGDTFNGTMAAMLAEGMDWRESLTMACAASAISVGGRGAQSSIPQRKEVEEFIKALENKTD